MKTRKEFFKTVKQGKSLEPITIWEKQYYYGWVFKKKFKNRSMIDKLNRLKELSKIIIGNSKKQRKYHYAGNKICFVCKKKKAYCWHHLILIKNGGYDNLLNRIPICNNCHSFIHAWLLEDDLTREFREIIK